MRNIYHKLYKNLTKFHFDATWNSKETIKSLASNTAQKLKFSVMNFFSKYDQIRRPNLWETININQKNNYDEFVTCALRQSKINSNHRKLPDCNILPIYCKKLRI